MNNAETMREHYAVCALWSSMDDRQTPLDRDHGIDDISDETWAEMLADCESFLDKHGDDVGDLLEQAGHDLWLTRNGHGSGFWDVGRPWAKDAAERMSETARAMPE